MKTNDNRIYEHVKDNVYIVRTGKYRNYYKKIKCDQCGKEIYRSSRDKVQYSVCSVECRSKYKQENGLLKQFEIGKLYPIEGKVDEFRFWTGISWNYRIATKCSQCGKEILIENRDRHEVHFCNDDCKYRYSDPTGSSIMSLKDTDNFHYLIGFIATDGTIDKETRGNVVYINIHQRDTEILERIQKIFGGHITKYQGSLPNAVPMVSWHICNKEFIQYLRSIGFTSNKSLTLNINSYFQSLTLTQKWAFMRGIMDGDGSVCKTSDGRLIVSFVSGSKYFIEMVLDFYCKYNYSKLNVSARIGKLSKNTYYAFKFTHRNAHIILNELYKNISNNLYLLRKYNNIREFLHA